MSKILIMKYIVFFFFFVAASADAQTADSLQRLKDSVWISEQPNWKIYQHIPAVKKIFVNGSIEYVDFLNDFTTGQFQYFVAIMKYCDTFHSVHQFPNGTQVVVYDTLPPEYIHGSWFFHPGKTMIVILPNKKCYSVFSYSPERAQFRLGIFFRLNDRNAEIPDRLFPWIGQYPGRMLAYFLPFQKKQAPR